MKVIKTIINAFNYISIAAIVIMVVITFSDVLGRLVFIKPVVGATEYCEMLMVVMLTAMGGSLLARKTVQVDVLLDILPKKIALIIDTIVLVVCAAFCIFVAYGTYLNGLFALNVSRIYTFLKVPHWPFLMLLAFSFIIAAAATILFMIIMHNTKDKSKSVLDHADLAILEESDS